MVTAYSDVFLMLCGAQSSTTSLFATMLYATSLKCDNIHEFNILQECGTWRKLSRKLSSHISVLFHFQLKNMCLSPKWMTYLCMVGAPSWKQLHISCRHPLGCIMRVIETSHHALGLCTERSMSQRIQNQLFCSGKMKTTSSTSTRCECCVLFVRSFNFYVQSKLTQACKIYP